MDHPIKAVYTIQFVLFGCHFGVCNQVLQSYIQPSTSYMSIPRVYIHQNENRVRQIVQFDLTSL